MHPQGIDLFPIQNKDQSQSCDMDAFNDSNSAEQVAHGHKEASHEQL
jgi:hypothetical protein